MTTHRLTYINDQILELASIAPVSMLDVVKMGFRISANLGDRKPQFRIGRWAPATEHVEVVIDDERIEREQASRILRLMADRLLECNWPPDANCPAPDSPVLSRASST